MDKLRKGDRVRVMATVKYDQDEDSKNAFLTVDGSPDLTMVDAAAVEFVHHEIKPGMWVENCSEGEFGEVLAAEVSNAWVRKTNGGFATWPFANLAPIDPKTLNRLDEAIRLVPRHIEQKEAAA